MSVASTLDPAASHLTACLESAVLRADDARHAAMVAHDLGALSNLLSDSLVYTHSTGRRESKTQYLNSLINGRVRYVELKRSQARLDAYGSVIVMNGNSSIRAITQGEMKYVRNLFLSVWVMSEAGWQMAAWTSVVDPAPLS